jgi:hypothetical protein
MSVIRNPAFFKLISFIAIAFPGGYRFLCVLAITSLFTTGIAESFSKGFFWVVLITTFSGIPIAAAMSNRLKQVTLQQAYFYVVISTTFMVAIVGFIIFSHEEKKILIEIYLASLSLSLYEINRKIFFNDGRYIETFICGCISTVLLLVIFLCADQYFLAFSFIVLFLPIGILNLIKKINNENTVIANSELLSSYRNFAFSNMFSTSLNSALPIVLIAIIGNEIAPQMAQVFSLSSLLLLLPRVISVRNIPKLREQGPKKTIIIPFYDLMKKYIVFIGIISLPSFYFYFEQDYWFLLWLLFFGIQLSQLCLPFSNLLSVEGKSSKLLLINFKGVVFYFILSLLSYVFIEEEFALTFMMLFCGHQLFKLLLTKRICRNLFI